MKTKIMMSLMLSAVAISGTAMAQENEPSKLRLAPTEIDLETRDTLSDSIQAAAGNVVGVADQLAGIRVQLVRCMNPLVHEDGEITQMSKLEDCLTDEAVGARDSFLKLGGAFTQAETAMREGSTQYQNHADATDGVIVSYRDELTTLEEEKATLMDFRQKVVAYTQDGKPLDAEQKKAVREAAYRMDRMQSRSDTVRQIINFKKSEQSFFLKVSDNLENSADQLNAQSYRAYHEADKQSDYIELAAARQDVRNIHELQVGARTDFDKLWASVGDMTEVFNKIGADRALLGKGPNLDPDEGEWATDKFEDEVVARFLGGAEFVSAGSTVVEGPGQ